MTQTRLEFKPLVPLVPTGPLLARLNKAFAEFHLNNPDVYLRLVKLARDMRAKGHRRMGIGMLYEVLRWQHAMQTFPLTDDLYKLNNNHRSRYARLIMANEPDLADAFVTRENAEKQLLEIDDLVAVKR